MHWIIPFEIVDFNILLCIIFMHHIIRSGFSGSAGCIESGVICMMRSSRDSEIHGYVDVNLEEQWTRTNMCFPPKGPLDRRVTKHCCYRLNIWTSILRFDDSTSRFSLSLQEPVQLLMVKWLINAVFLVLVKWISVVMCTNEWCVSLHETLWDEWRFMTVVHYQLFWSGQIRRVYLAWILN